MTNLTPEQIRDGIDCADGFDLTENHLTLPSGYYFTVNSADDFRPWMLAALASQLISQLENAGYRVTVYGAYVSIEGSGRDCDYKGRAHKRDENSILACTELFRSLK